MIPGHHGPTLVGSTDTASDRQESRVTDHPMIGSHAALRDVPRATERLERLDVLEPVALQRQHELLDLDGRWAGTRTATPPGSSTACERSERRPRLGQVEHAPVEAIVGSAISATSPSRRSRAIRVVSRRTPRRFRPLDRDAPRAARTETTRPSGPVARHSAMVRAPDPVPASSTRAPGKMSAYTMMGPRSFG